ncbi:hypothetical protein K3495_g7865 [Podosphaera aphanis]|nr:hypothetical protein K3495_g7865 [Podosphaera aphanis]
MKYTSKILQKKSQRLQKLLNDSKVDPKILLEKELRQPTSDESLINALSISEISPELGIVDKILSANRNAPSLQTLRVQATSNVPNEFALENGLLLYKDRLVVPDINNIRTSLIREVHD